MDPWKPKYKALYDTIDNIGHAILLVAEVAVLFAIVALTI